MIRRLTALLPALVLLLGGALLAGQEKRQELVNRTEEYRQRLRELIPQYERQLALASAALEQRNTLFKEGLVSRQEIEAAEHLRLNAESEVADLRRQLVACDQLEAEARLTEELESPREEAKAVLETVFLFDGPTRWSLAGVPKIEEFFYSRFGSNLPVSAYGQTALHTRMGFAHQEAVDIALHPDSDEGMQLLNYLRQAGISFIAFRQPVIGSATGAHIHIGKPSLRSTPGGGRTADAAASEQ